MRRIIALKKKPLTGKRDYRPRRVWTLQQKLEMLAYAELTSTVQAARFYDVDIRLIFQWRSDQREGLLAQRTWGQPGKRKKKFAEPLAETADDDS